MSRKTISQREARALRKRVEHLEQQEDRRRNSFSANYPGGVHIGQVHVAAGDGDPVLTATKTARELGHAVVVVNNSDRLDYYALPLSKAS